MALYSRGKRAVLSLESLESRLNLSKVGLLPHPSPSSNYLASVITEGRGRSERIRVELGIGDAAIGATAIGAGTTTVPITSYSSIYNSRLETRPSGQNIGWVSTSGAYVEYQVTAAQAGSYTLSLGLAATANASMGVMVNGAAPTTLSIPSTGSWDTYRTTTTTVSLAAGTSTIRLSALNGTQYNLNAVSLTAPKGTTVASTGASTVPVAGYSSIWNSRLETRPSGQNIGWVSTSGAYVEYGLNVVQGGSYNLSLGLAAERNARLDVYGNGTLLTSYDIAATGGWDSYTTLTKAVSLAAGNVTLRISAAGGTQYNLNAISLSPVTAVNTPTVTTPPTPTSGSTISVTSAWMTSFSQLNVLGTSGNDAITVTQSGSTLYITGNGQTTSYTGSYGNLVIKGGAGNDTITVDASVTVPTLVYAGSGTDTIRNLTRAKATIVAIGNGADSITGNGINTSYWVDSNDNITASAGEWSAGRVHQVSGFYGGVSTQLLGQNLADPVSGSSATTRLTSSSLWGTGPVQEDVNQGQLANCFITAPLAALARQSPDRLQEIAVDLGDGTYAVQFVRNGVKSFVRVDGDLAAGGPYAGGLLYSHPGASGNQWAAIIEKAYAFYRTGAGTYASINLGYPTAAFSDLGVANTTFTVSSDASVAFNAISSALAAGKSIVVGTPSTVQLGAPLAPSHGYSLIAASKDAWGNMSFTLRNPWGFDGAGSDSNTSDGLVTLSYAQLKANNVTSAITT